MMPRWFRLIRYVLPYKWKMAAIIGLSAAEILLDVLKPWPMKWIVDDVLANQKTPATIPLVGDHLDRLSLQSLLAVFAVATIVLFMASELSRFAKSLMSSAVGGLAKNRLSSELLDHLQRQSLTTLKNHRTGDLIKRIADDSGCVKELVLDGCLSILTSIATLTAIGSVMFHLDGRMFLIALFVSPLQVVLIRFFNQPMVEAAYTHQQLEGEIMTMTEQTLSAVPVIQAFLREEHEDERFKSLTTKTLRAYLESLFTQLQFSIAIGSVSALGTAAMMLVGGLSVLQGNISLGVFVVFLSYLVSLYEPMETLAYLSSSFANASASSRRVYEILDSEDYVHEQPNALPLGAYGRDTSCEIVIANVHFGYKPHRPILKGVSLEIGSGQTVALIGASGVGKSTLVSLIPRLSDPWSGQVLLNGVDIKLLQLSSLRSQISMVLQESFLLPISIRENIAYGRPEATFKEIVAAAEDANADSFIQNLPRGYDTVIGERGGTLSGGQKQRLAIARALLKNAPLLILDEPTAALDAQTEALMMQAIERLKAGRTTLIIAHRLATVCHADQICVLSEGRISEQGKHQELLERSSYYQRLHSLSTFH